MSTLGLSILKHLEMKTKSRPAAGIQAEDEDGEKGDWSDFESDIVVGATHARLRISVTADLLGFSYTAITRV